MIQPDESDAPALSAATHGGRLRPRDHVVGMPFRLSIGVVADDKHSGEIHRDGDEIEYLIGHGCLLIVGECADGQGEVLQEALDDARHAVGCGRLVVADEQLGTEHCYDLERFAAEDAVGDVDAAD